MTTPTLAKSCCGLLLDRLTYVLLLVAAVRFFQIAIYHGHDFEVYWKAMHAWISGVSPYHYTPEMVGFVFKYPPWLLPLFLPFSLASLYTARVFWATIQFFSIAYAFFWLIREGVAKRTAILVLLLYWWIWIGHAYSGQITVFCLMVGLWSARNVKSSVRFSTALVIFSSKIFSLFTFLGRWKEILQLRFILGVLGFIVLANAIVFWVDQKWGANAGIFDIYINWIKAASSGNAELGSEVVRGQMNHGFVAGILRWIPVSFTNIYYDIGVSLVLMTFFGTLWMRASRRLSGAESFAGWLAFGVVVLPLAWSHSFVLTFPLSALALDRAIRTKKKKLIFTALMGIIFIGILVSQIFGNTLVRPIELVNIKSWGVCLTAWALYQSQNLG
ncbi:MAG: hypothetical protein HY843_09075 [Bdellovibrio sp.]|nr:hypothetical protein [Bdellovibrio sp.]